MLAPEDQCYSIKLYSIVFTRSYVLELHDFNNNMAVTLLSSFVLAYYPFMPHFPLRRFLGKPQLGWLVLLYSWEGSHRIPLWRGENVKIF